MIISGSSGYQPIIRFKLVSSRPMLRIWPIWRCSIHAPEDKESAEHRDTLASEPINITHTLSLASYCSGGSYNQRQSKGNSAAVTGGTKAEARWNKANCVHHRRLEAPTLPCSGSWSGQWQKYTWAKANFPHNECAVIYALSLPILSYLICSPKAAGLHQGLSKFSCCDREMGSLQPQLMIYRHNETQI